MKEEMRWEKELRLKEKMCHLLQNHNILLSHIRDELCRIANAMGGAAPEEDDCFIKPVQLGEDNNDSV